MEKLKKDENEKPISRYEALSMPIKEKLGMVKKRKRSLRKFLTSIITIMGICIIALLSCKKEPMDEMYEVRFEINAMKIENPNSYKSNAIYDLFKSMMISPEEVSHVSIGVDGTHENPIYSEIMPYNIENGITDGMRLPIGNHSLVSLTLLKDLGDENYEVLYSAVAEGAELAQYIDKTIPIAFEVPLFDDIPVAVDVVALDGWTPEAFGWAVYDISITTVYPLYFYGAMDDGTQSVMNMEVYNGTELISTSTVEPEGWIKILYPDVYTIPNNNELYEFFLMKDDILYSRSWNVEELLALPQEVHLLNVYGSGMMGFEEIMMETSAMFSMNNSFSPGGNGENFGFEVRNDKGILIWSCNITQGDKTFTYPNSIMNNADEYVEITLMMQLWNNGVGVWGDTQTLIANVNVETLLSTTGTIEMGPYSGNYYWLFN